MERPDKADKVYYNVVNGKFRDWLWESDNRQYIEHLETKLKNLGVIGDVVGQSEQLCEVCNSNEAKVTYNICRPCEDTINNV